MTPPPPSPGVPERLPERCGAAPRVTSLTPETKSASSDVQRCPGPSPGPARPGPLPSTPESSLAQTARTDLCPSPLSWGPGASAQPPRVPDPWDRDQDWDRDRGVGVAAARILPKPGQAEGGGLLGFAFFLGFFFFFLRQGLATQFRPPARRIFIQCVYNSVALLFQRGKVLPVVTQAGQGGLRVMLPPQGSRPREERGPQSRVRLRSPSLRELGGDLPRPSFRVTRALGT